MKDKMVFATKNANKITEIKKILTDQFEILSLRDIGFEEDIDETSDTLEGNALIKSSLIYKRFNLNCFADDTGLEVETLDGLPGVYSARYAGEENNAEKNIQKLLENLKNKSNRNARFRTVISLIINDKEIYFEGIIKGKISKLKKGSMGFGYDPVFIPDGYKKTFAEMELDEKNKISHRAIAMQKLINYLAITHRI
ncbi:MAG: non-canonical purine NTP diphosphatase [Bacteroidetes bacterium]|nr:non-canonical purine NTP diphosphatase [Bacteroidota bacterium]